MYCHLLQISSCFATNFLTTRELFMRSSTPGPDRPDEKNPDPLKCGCLGRNSISFRVYDGTEKDKFVGG
ncbi:hypothetical protein CDAR_433231 [Caerostris darwini]|uniref:Uncharacterized protein n=1 Tax=Caerostris darwini TaxID=1538125 RepID=A0AAV4QI60_9ARAC|nr:hypothetical protein CDAR_433231 [Caerostris darwini]